MAHAEVTVIVPVWNRRDLLVRLIERLRSQTRPAAQLLVVDNGSEDDSAEIAQQLGATVIRLGRNCGFASAVNQGISAAQTPWVAVVNNDVEPAPQWLERLTDAAAAQSAWFATGKILSAQRPDLIDGTYDALCRGGCAWRVGNMRRDGAIFSSPRPIRFASFTAALFRTSLFAQVGLMDERFESYLEDVEFGLRCARMNCGGIYVPEALAWHQGSATLGRWHPDSVRRIARNQLLLVARHYSASMLRRYAWHILVSQALWGLVAARHGAGGAFLRGKLEGLRTFRSIRAGGEILGTACLSEILEDSEREIHDIQRETYFEPYWRLYFLLTGGSPR